MGLKKSLTENLGAKIIAVVVALFIWFNASGQKEVIWLKMVPITLDNIPDSLIITGNIPQQAEISITGNKRQLMLMGFKRLALGIDLSQATPGRQRVSLSPRQIQLPSGIDRRNVRILEPLSIDLQLELLVTRRVPVTLSTAGTLPDDLILEGSFSITPSWVSITGPASVAQNIRSMATEALDQSKIKSSFERELPIVIGARQLECEPDRVTVSVRVNEKGQRVLSNVPPTVLVDSEDVVAEGRVARAATRHLNVGHADRVKDVVVERGLPMVFEKLLGDVVDEVGTSAKCGIEISGDASLRSLTDQHRSRWVVFSRAALKLGVQCVELSNLPETIRLEVPERVLRVEAFPRRAELGEELSEVLVQFLERHQARLAPLDSRKGVQQEQGLVRGAFVTAAPNVDLGEACEELVIA